MRPRKAVTESVHAGSGEYCSSIAVAVAKSEILGRAMKVKIFPKT